MKAHLLKTFTNQADHHVTLAKSAKALSTHFAALAECAKAAKSEMQDGPPDIATLCAKASGEFATQSEAHTAAAENYMGLCKALQESRKAALSSDDDLLPLPAGLSTLTPTKPGVFAVPRAGQQPLPEKPNVPREFEKLVSVDDNE
jgi:hypothetical protein